MVLHLPEQHDAWVLALGHVSPVRRGVSFAMQHLFALQVAGAVH